MRDVLDIVPDGADHVALHDLHMVDVVEQFEPIRTDAFAKLDTPSRVVALVILVIHLAVEQFHDQCHLVLFGKSHQAFQADGAIFQSLLIGFAVAVAREANEGVVARRSHFRYHLLVVCNQRVVQGRVVETFFNALPGSPRQGRREAVFLQHRPLFWPHQLNGLDAHGLGGLAEFLQRDFAVAPAAYRVFDVALELYIDWLHGKGRCGDAAQQGGSAEHFLGRQAA